MSNATQLKRVPVAPDEMPEPQRSLLVHENDMTSTLAAHHNHDILLDVIEMEQSANLVVRTVLLKAGDKPVEYGWISIYLPSFNATAQNLIQAGEKPLGWILEHTDTIYLCDPHTYFKVEPTPDLLDLLDCAPSTEPPPPELFGRINRITNPDGDLLADVVEILPTEHS